MATFADRLRQLRIENKLSQQELADRLRISRSSVGMYEQGRRGPDFELLDNVADLFDVDFNYMLGKTDERGHYPKSGKKVTLNFTTDEITLISPQEIKEVVAAYIDATAEIREAVRRVLGVDR